MVDDNCFNSLEERKRKEIEHTDRRRSIVKAHEYKTDASKDQKDVAFIEDSAEYNEHFSNMKFYSISGKSFSYRDKCLYENISGKTVLDYCCGNGEIAIELANKGAKKVNAIDISQVAVNNANEMAAQYGYSDICEFSVMDAENMSYDNDSFDIIHEYGALHHLELGSAFRELSRVLKPDGRLVCTEALRHNPLIHMYRKRTPNLRTKWEVEHILGVPEIQSGQKYFNKIEIRFFHLAALAAVPFRKSPFFKPLLGLLDRVDSVLLRLPFISKMAWVAVIVYSEPKK